MDAVAFAARQLSDLLRLVDALEMEGADIGARLHFMLADIHHLGAARDFLPDIIVGLQIVAALVDKAKVDGVADDDFTIVGGFLSGNQLEQRRLARAIGSDHTDDAARRQRKGTVLEQQLVTISLRSEEHTSELQSLMR